MSFWLFPIQIFSSSSSFCPAAWRLPTPLPFVLSHEERSCLFQNFYFHFLDLLLMWEWSLKSRLCVCRDFIPTTREAKQRRTTREDEQNKPEAKLDKKKKTSQRSCWLNMSELPSNIMSIHAVLDGNHRLWVSAHDHNVPKFAELYLQTVVSSFHWPVSQPSPITSVLPHQMKMLKVTLLLPRRCLYLPQHFSAPLVRRQVMRGLFKLWALFGL